MRNNINYTQQTGKTAYPTSRISFRVRYAETDAMGIVHHSRYLPWMELGRTELLRQIGCSYRQTEENGYFFPIIEAYCRYHSPARYDDLVNVETTIKEIRPPYIEFYYQITGETDGILLVTGRTKQICLNKEGAIRRKPLREMEKMLHSPKEKH